MTNIPEIEPDDFVRRYAFRAKNLMWLLGAGASAAGGIPTAGEMVWQFKQQLYSTQRRVAPQLVADLTNAAVRSQLQSHIDALGSLPKANGAGEYAALFEAAYPSESDRRAFLDAKVSGGKPSYGHVALATLMRAGLVRLVWTTNFDSLVADACAKVYDRTGALTMGSLDAPVVALQAIHEQRWPVEVKLHGDFRSRRLKNTSDELRAQDQQLRDQLHLSCQQFGLVVVGYSGRDDSVMDVLDAALSSPSPFPAGLFWLHRGDDPIADRVTKLLLAAGARNVEAFLVRVVNFDEIVRDLVRPLSGLDSSALDAFSDTRNPWSDAPAPSGRKGWPVVRLNAVAVTRVPTTCRRIECKIGGTAEVRGAARKAAREVLVARTKAGVLAFGADKDLRDVYGEYGIGEFDLHAIGSGRLRYDSAERGLLREALTLAIADRRALTPVRRRSSDLLYPTDASAPAWRPLKQLVSDLKGSVQGFPELRWHEGVGIRLDWADDRLWLLIEPRVVFEGATEDNKTVAAEFARERGVRRYNRILDKLIAFWSGVLAGNGDELRALGISDGVDAVFTLGSTNAFSRRAGA